MTVTDTNQVTTTKGFTFTVDPPLTINPASLPAGAVNEPYPNNASTTITASGGSGSYTWSATGLPAGLTIVPSTGTITGTPAAAGPATVAVNSHRRECSHGYEELPPHR